MTIIQTEYKPETIEISFTVDSKVVKYPNGIQQTITLDELNQQKAMLIYKKDFVLSQMQLNQADIDAVIAAATPPAE